MNDASKIDLKRYSKEKILLFRKDLIDQLRPQLLKIKDETDLIVSALKVVEPFASSKGWTRGRLGVSIQTLVLHFLDNEQQPNYQELFIRKVLGIRALPIVVYGEIETVVKGDLRKINALIKRYEKEEYIKKLVSDGEKPRNHEQKILRDYYKRCLIEREIILDFMLDGIGQNAIESMYLNEGPLAIFGELVRQFKNRPYSLWLPFKEHFFDSSKIDDFWHKVRNFPIGDEQKAEKLYHQDKSSFYKRFFKENKHGIIFEKMMYYLYQLPIKKGREPIFLELKSLFERKLFIGFYALALTQIEGLFGEMNEAITGGTNTGNSALPEKVQMVRKYHEMSDHYLDYYQYQIPRLRNKFMHSGYDEDFKLKSYDLLLDLLHLLVIFDELKNPLVQLKKILRNSEPADFTSYRHVAKYFELLDGLMPQQRKELEGDIIDFEKHVLTEQADVEHICRNVIADSPNQFSFLNKYIMVHNDFSKIVNLNKHGRQILIGDKGEMSKLAAQIEKNGRMYWNLICYGRFLNGYQKHLPSLPNDVKQSLSKVAHEFKKVMVNFTGIYDELLKNQMITVWGR